MEGKFKTRIACATIFILALTESNTAKDKHANSTETPIENNFDGLDSYYDYYDYNDCVNDRYSGSKPCCDWECDSYSKASLSSCNCDDICHVYDDCCARANSHSYQDYSMKNTSFNCLYIPRIYSRWFVFIVNTCPDGTNYDLQKLCTDPDEHNIYSDTPTTSFGTRFLYRNMYCVMCNGVEDFVLWKVALRCHWKPREHAKFGNLSIEELYLGDKCFLYYKEPLAHSYRRCYPTISSCPETSNETTVFSDQMDVNIARCENDGNRYVYTSDVIYKNPACYECNHGNGGEEATCSDYAFEDKHINNKLSHRRFTLNFYFDPSTQRSEVTRYMYNEVTTVEQISFVGRCGPLDAYDPLNGVCRKLCGTSDINCNNNLIKAPNHIKEYESDDYEYSFQYNVNYWSDLVGEYYIDDEPYDPSDLDGPVCKEHWTCTDNLPVIPTEIRDCSCDPLCIVYKDCCHNANASPEDETVDISFDCAYIPRVEDSIFIFVNSCPEGTDHELLRLCVEPDEQNVYSSTPVSALSTGFLYRNMYCAVCNGIDDYAFWKSKLRCNWMRNLDSELRNLSIAELYMIDRCSFFHEPPKANINFRACYPKITSCPETANEFKTLPNTDIAYECTNGDNRYAHSLIHSLPLPLSFHLQTLCRLIESSAALSSR